MPFMLSERDNQLHHVPSAWENEEELSSYAETTHNYLRNLLLDTMAAMPLYEVDPTKATRQDIVQNLKNVEYLASAFEA